MEKALHDMLTRVVKGEQTTFDLVKDLEGGGNKLVVEQRILNPEEPRKPQRAETESRAHRFFSAKGFIAYLEDYGSKGTVIYADSKRRMLHAVLNESDAGGVEIVTLEPQVHPRWEPWDKMLDETMPLAAFVDFLRNNRRAINDPDGRELLLTLSQVKASTEVTLHQGSGKESLNGLMLKTRIQGKENTELVDLPDIITLKTPIYVSEPEVDIELDVIIDAVQGGQGIVARFASADILEARITAFETIVKRISSLEKEIEAVVTDGAPEYIPWTYII